MLAPLAVLSCTACASVPSPGNTGDGFTYTVTMEAGRDAMRRSYRLHAPRGYRPGKPVPLVVVLHGAFSTSSEMERVTGFSALADREGFAVVYPDGIGILGFLQHWNAGHCCGIAADEAIDDVGFIAEVIEDAKAYIDIDAARVFMVGYSNGAMLTHRFAAERSELLAAAAPLAGSIGSAEAANDWRIPPPSTSVPIIMFHGLDDDRVPYGRTDTNDDSSDGGFYSVGESSRFWWSNNGCKRHHRTRDNVYDGVTIDTWSDCDENAAVQLLSLHGWGHRWPGPYFSENPGNGSDLEGFDAAEIIWSFFEQHGRRQEST